MDMYILNHDDINILDLPDEMLLAIFNKLNTTDMLYSLVDVNQRFDRLVLDSLVIHHLKFVIKRDDIHSSAVEVDILSRICSEILPRVNEKITKLTLGSDSMERVINAVDYPLLHSLSLVNYQPEILLRHLSNETMLHLLTNQITHIIVDVNVENVAISIKDEADIFVIILLISKRLSDLTFLQKSSERYLTISVLNILYRIDSLSLTLTKLTINVNSFDDCLYLLNGCLESLSTLIIRIKKITRSLSEIDNTKKLFKLKHFSIATDFYTRCYDTEVVPLLRRMLNLEELTLFLSVGRTKSTYIDGNQLYDDVLNYMPQINKFIFNIHTYITNDFIINDNINVDLPSNDDIRNSFIKRGFKSIDTCADDKLIKKRGSCHVYSLPYQFNEFLFMKSCFQGGKFDKVRFLTMIDIRPFEHELFKVISQDFPFLQELYICNDHRQINKYHDSFTLITFNHLFKLHLYSVHKDYVIQFLSDKSTRLPCLTNLTIEYDRLVIVTNNFTNDTTRLNCSKIKYLVTHKPFVRSQDFVSYFPSL